MKTSKKIIKACLDIISRVDNNNTLYEVLDEYITEGLTISEVFYISTALDYYYSEGKTFFQPGGENTMSDCTDYDLVNSIKKIIGNPNNMKYRQYTSVECWDDNNDFFSSIMNEINDGKMQEVVDTLKKLPQSNREPIDYKDICNNAITLGERITYDNGEYILTYSIDTFTLYERVNK